MHRRPSGPPLFPALILRLLAVVVLVATAVLAAPTAAGAHSETGADIGSPLRQEDAAAGSLDPADRDVLHKVKQAGLWRCRSARGRVSGARAPVSARSAG